MEKHHCGRWWYLIIELGNVTSNNQISIIKYHHVGNANITIIIIITTWWYLMINMMIYWWLWHSIMLGLPMFDIFDDHDTHWILMIWIWILLIMTTTFYWYMIEIRDVCWDVLGTLNHVCSMIIIPNRQIATSKGEPSHRFIRYVYVCPPSGKHTKLIEHDHRNSWCGRMWKMGNHLNSFNAPTWL